MRPVTLCFSGLDPSGGAGLQADIETIAALGGHAAVVATALTVQDSQQVHGFVLIDPDLMQAQARCVLADLPVAAIKIGMLGSAQAVSTVFDSLSAHRHLPVVLDPVLSANSGGTLAHADLRKALLKALPWATVITPNSVEARLLSGCDDLDEAVAELTLAGAGAIWLTGGHEAGDSLVNKLYQQGLLVLETRQRRLTGEFHGSGCTLASALAALLAAGCDLKSAARQAEAYVHEALSHADRPRNHGQYLPRRIPARATERLPRANLQNVISGLYAITDASLGDELLSAVAAALEGGVRIVQYRDKSDDVVRREREARALLDLCRLYQVPLLINDDVALAEKIGADGVHLGQGDGDVALARQRLGAEAIIGVTCHDSLQLAAAAVTAGADYLAFGAMQASSSKPQARLCPLATLSLAHARFDLPLVAIGGITPDNAGQIISAGASAVAVIASLWQSKDRRARAQQFSQEFASR